MAYSASSVSHCGCITWQLFQKKEGEKGERKGSEGELRAVCHSQVNSPPSLRSGGQSVFSLSSVVFLWNNVAP